MDDLTADGIDRVQDAESFVEFVARLRRDDDVEDLTLDEFLEQLQAWIRDGLALGESDLFAADPASWRFAADLLLGAAGAE
jgi:hypothetical protein